MRTCAFALLSPPFINPPGQFTARQFPFDIKVVARSIYFVSSYLVRALNFSDPVGDHQIVHHNLYLSRVIDACQVTHVKARARFYITEGTLFVGAIFRS